MIRRADLLSLGEGVALMHPLLILAVGIRVGALLLFPAFCADLGEMIQIATPPVREGLFLFNHGLDPYNSTSFTQAPLLLAFFNLFWTWMLDLIMPVLWIGLDYLSWRALRVIAEYQVKRPDEWLDFVSADDQEIIDDLAAVDTETTADSLDEKPLLDANEHTVDSSIPPKYTIDPEKVGVFYLLNPYTILTCIGYSTQSFSTTLTLVSIALATRNHGNLALVLISVAAYLSVYPVMFIVPIVLILSKNDNLNRFNSAFVVCGTLIGLIYLSYLYMGNWTFINRFYGTLLLVKDLKPNLGLYWYLVIEIFEQFRFFFVFVFQTLAFIFAVPLGIRFVADPVFVTLILAVFISFMKSYPSIADFGIYFGLLQYMGELGLVIGIQFGVLCMSPVFYNLWLYSGAGNANFFYALTLAKAGCEVLLMGSLLTAYQQREYERLNPGIRKLRLELANVQAK